MQITNKQVSILGPMSVIDQHPEMKPVHLQGFKKILLIVKHRKPQNDSLMMLSGGKNQVLGNFLCQLKESV